MSPKVCIMIEIVWELGIQLKLCIYCHKKFEFWVQKTDAVTIVRFSWAAAFAGNFANGAEERVVISFLDRHLKEQRRKEVGVRGCHLGIFGKLLYLSTNFGCDQNH